MSICGGGSGKKGRPGGILRASLFTCGGASVDVQIILHQSLQQLVPIHLADEGAGGVVVGDVGGVLGQDVAHDLVDGVVASPSAPRKRWSKRDEFARLCPVRR